MLNEIITVYAIIDDLLKAIGHSEDSRRQMNDAEIMTTVITAAMFFGGNQSQACDYMRDHHLVSNNPSCGLLNFRFFCIRRFMRSPSQVDGCA
nr:hypothetical protein [Nostoc sp. 'Peltigera membranacea cyanobiont' 232]